MTDQDLVQEVVPFDDRPSCSGVPSLRERSDRVTAARTQVEVCHQHPQYDDGTYRAKG